MTGDLLSQVAFLAALVWVITGVLKPVARQFMPARMLAFVIAIALSALAYFSGYARDTGLFVLAGQTIMAALGANIAQNLSKPQQPAREE